MNEQFPHIEEILSPDLQLERKREQAQAIRLEKSRGFKVGDFVRAGPNGKPGILESISEEGFAAIRWPDGSLLCGVDDLQRCDPAVGAQKPGGVRETLHDMLG